MGFLLRAIGVPFIGASLLLPAHTQLLQKADPTTTQTAKEPRHKLVPDFCQRDTRFGPLPKNACGPVAASNLLIYLNNTGFPNLLSKENPGPEDQAKLINLLSSDKYMKLDKETGVSPYNLMTGLNQYVTDRNYKIDIEYIGYQVDQIDKEQNLNGGENITPKIIEAKLKQGSECILRIGYYKDNARVDGHYGTVVGLKEGNPHKILIHDPSKSSGLEKRQDLWELTKDKNKWQVSGVVNAYPGETVYLDGVIVFKVSEK